MDGIQRPQAATQPVNVKPPTMRGFDMDWAQEVATRKVDDGHGRTYNLTVSVAGLDASAIDIKLAAFTPQVCTKYAEIGSLMKLGQAGKTKGGKTLEELKFKQNEENHVSGVTKIYTGNERKEVKSDEWEKSKSAIQLPASTEANKKLLQLSSKIDLFKSLNTELAKTPALQNQANATRTENPLPTNEEKSTADILGAKPQTKPITPSKRANQAGKPQATAAAMPQQLKNALSKIDFLDNKINVLQKKVKSNSVTKTEVNEAQKLQKLKNKRDIYTKAVTEFHSKNITSNMQHCQLTPHQLKQFQVINNTPDWHKAIFTDTPCEVKNNSGFYTYQPSGGGSVDVWVDFANAKLGGGCFEGGFVQEEVMIAETPDLALFIADRMNADKTRCAVETRDGKDIPNQKAPLGCNPTPQYFTDANRVLSINAYGQDIAKTDLMNQVKVLDVPQKINVLAIAAPDLSQIAGSKVQLPVALDIFNTLMAGIELTKQQHPGQKLVINSGKFGCGAFANDPQLVYLLHKLAAQHTGVDVTFYALSDNDAKKYNDVWDMIEGSLKGKTLHECVSTISSTLEKAKGV